MNGRCYYFEAPFAKNFNDTKAYCKTIFGNGINGRIYEPRSKNQMNLVLKEASTFSDGVFYVGVTNMVLNTEFRYDSNNELVSMEIPWRGGSPPSSKRCVCASSSNGQVTWSSGSCNCCAYLICEVA